MELEIPLKKEEEKFLELINRLEINISSYKALQNELNKDVTKARIIELCSKVKQKGKK